VFLHTYLQFMQVILLSTKRPFNSKFYPPFVFMEKLLYFCYKPVYKSNAIKKGYLTFCGKLGILQKMFDKGKIIEDYVKRNCDQFDKRHNIITDRSAHIEIFKEHLKDYSGSELELYFKLKKIERSFSDAHREIVTLELGDPPGIY